MSRGVDPRMFQARSWHSEIPTPDSMVMYARVTAIPIQLKASCQPHRTTSPLHISFTVFRAPSIWFMPTLEPKYKHEYNKSKVNMYT